MKLRVILILIFGYCSVSACAQKKVYDILADKDVEPNVMYKKGNYIKDPYLNQYVGSWESDSYQLRLKEVKKIEMKGAYKDEIRGYLIKKSKVENKRLQFGLRLNSTSTKSAYGRFLDINKYDFFLYFSTDERRILRMEINQNEVIRVNEGIKSDSIQLPELIMFRKNY